MDSTDHMICLLRVETTSAGWEKTLNKVLKSIKGVSFVIDTEKGEATVSGKIRVDKILLKLTKAKKHAEIVWLHSANNTPHPNFNNNLHAQLTPMMHGYGHGYGYNYYDHHPYSPYMAGPHHYDQQYYDQQYYDHRYYDQQYYHHPPARSFPQPPPPIENPRLESLCNMM